MNLSSLLQWFKPKTEAPKSTMFEEDRARRESRLRIIRRRQLELRDEIAKAIRLKLRRKHLYAAQAMLTEERLKLEGVS